MLPGRPAIARAQTSLTGIEIAMNTEDESTQSARPQGGDVSRRRILQGMAGLAAVGSVPLVTEAAPVTSKTVFMSFLLHGNMCYDRYTKQEIRDKFPRIYATGVRALAAHPEVTAHIDFPGLTLLSLKRYAPWFLKELKPLVDRRQVAMVGCQYAASHALAADEESDLVASRVTMELMRRELQPDCSTFFPQEMVFHPQLPYIMNQIGARRLIVMPDGWDRPRRVRGIDGSSVLVYPLDLRAIQLGKLEEYYDSHADGSFVMAGGDFEQLGDIDAYVSEIARLAQKGKIIRWTTVDRYEKEIGIHVECEAPHPFGQAQEDREPSPSFSRWMTHPQDMVWHGHAVPALDVLRAAGFAQAAATIHKLGAVDVPLKQSWTTLPDNPWDTRFEEVNEYPETEAQCLAPGGESTVLSRAWHHALIGLNSDSSGWFPWTPRTLHRQTVLDTSRSFSNEVLDRFAQQVASHIRRPASACAGYVLALNPTEARTAEVSLPVEGPLALVAADGSRLPGRVTFREGHWSATARVELPAYGYRLLGLQTERNKPAATWKTGSEIASYGRHVSLNAGRLVLAEGERKIEIAVAPFKLQDPSGAAKPEDVKPDWTRATTRVRETEFGPDLEIFTELAWAVWIRLVIGLRLSHVAVTANVQVDMPRRIGKLKYDPEGLLLEFLGWPGRVHYDVPYATIEHTNPEPSFIAAQRFASIDAGDAAFAVVTLGGNQSFRVAPRAGVVAASLGASIQGRADTRPECRILPSGYAEHLIRSGGDPFFGGSEHRFALLLCPPAGVAAGANRLRTGVPLFRVQPGNGNWPVQQSLLRLSTPAARVTAFRTHDGKCSMVLNNLGERPCAVRCGDESVTLPAFGIREVPVSL